MGVQWIQKAESVTTAIQFSLFLQTEYHNSYLYVHYYSCATGLLASEAMLNVTKDMQDLNPVR